MKSEEICELKLKDNIALSILKSNNRFDVEKKLNSILNDKKDELAKFSMEHSLMNIGMKMIVTPQKITCVFIASSNTDLNVSNEDLSNFIDIFSPEFELENVENRNKLLGYPKWFNLTEEDLKDYYLENLNSFDNLKDLLEHHNPLFKDYLYNIEDYVLNSKNM